MTPQDLKQWRIKNGYTQVTLSEALKTHSMTISQWERGIREIPSFLHLALRCLELEGGETNNREKKMEREV